MEKRLNVLKTYKIYIDGKYERSESGRYFALTDSKGKQIANICRSSRKDFRNAVVAARTAQPSWSERSAYNKVQILYRIAEMLEGRVSQFVDEMVSEGQSSKSAEIEVKKAIDHLVYYAGWCDKISQVFGTINPVASSHFNFSVPEAMGVIAIFAPEKNTFSGFVSSIAPIIAGGNSCVVLTSENSPLSALTFAEVLGTSDLPGGVVNILTGYESELLDPISTHMDVNGIAYHRASSDSKKTIQTNAALNIRRIYFYNKDKEPSVDQENPYRIMDFMEIKTTWHPVGV